MVFGIGQAGIKEIMRLIIRVNRLDITDISKVFHGCIMLGYWQVNTGLASRVILVSLPTRAFECP